MANPQLEKLDNQIKSAVKEIDKALAILGIIKQSKAKIITQLKYKTQILYDEYYKFLSIENLKKQVTPSGYDDYPYKLINNGYVVLYTRDFKRLMGEHRYIMEKAIGRKLSKDEIVHHIDKNPLNNKLENLQIVTKEEHREIHKKTGKKK